jgi:hypothetical protein
LQLHDTDVTCRQPEVQLSALTSSSPASSSNLVQLETDIFNIHVNAQFLTRFTIQPFRTMIRGEDHDGYGTTISIQ